MQKVVLSANAAARLRMISESNRKILKAALSELRKILIPSSGVKVLGEDRYAYLSGGFWIAFKYADRKCHVLDFFSEELVEAARQ